MIYKKNMIVMTAASGLVGGLLAGPVGAVIGGGIGMVIRNKELNDLNDYYQTIETILNQLEVRIGEDIETDQKFIDGMVMYVAQQRQLERETSNAAIDTTELVISSDDTDDLVNLLQDLQDAVTQFRSKLGNSNSNWQDYIN